MKTPEQKIALLEDSLAGHTVEKKPVKSKDDEWTICKLGIKRFNWKLYDYRVQTRKYAPREWWINMRFLWDDAYRTEEDARKNGGQGSETCIHVREISRIKNESAEVRRK